MLFLVAVKFPNRLFLLKPVELTGLFVFSLHVELTGPFIFSLPVEACVIDVRISISYFLVECHSFPIRISTSVTLFTLFPSFVVVFVLVSSDVGYQSNFDLTIDYPRAEVQSS